MTIERSKLLRGRWVVRSKKTGRILGVHKSKTHAKKQETAINLSKARKSCKGKRSKKCRRVPKKR